MKIRLPIKLIIALLCIVCGSAHIKAQNNNPVYIDKEGIMRWSHNNSEALFFGVNYTTPFAYGFRANQKLKVDAKTAIDKDVEHMARMGINAFRVHVWDTEISDSLGNLKVNEHLDLYDYLLAKLKKHHIKVVVTPIAFWGNGYPEKDEHTGSFSDIYGKTKALITPKAISAQENYLKQFFNHVNSYTGTTYQDDNNIIAAEVNNEPKHSGAGTKTTAYINSMYDAIKSTGWSKPIFYNISESFSYAEAITNSKADGYSFQWYPVGLVANHTQKGNFLPNVSQYLIPFDTLPRFQKKPLIVYEFDAGDIDGSYMYPQMARSFRQAGFQWATQFAYDPFSTAYANTEYQTHYLNLIYTPHKAISLMVANQVFRKSKMPLNDKDITFNSDYAHNVSEYHNDTLFYYSNHCKTPISTTNKLKHIAGVGNSSVIQYSGTGSYFLDKINKTQWRLEVMPDAIRVKDPFETTSLSKTVTTISYRDNDISISLPDFKSEYYVFNLSTKQSQQVSDTWKVAPGAYIISKKKINPDKIPNTFGANQLATNDYNMAQEKQNDLHVYHSSPEATTITNPLSIEATITGLADGDKAELIIETLSGQYETVTMEEYAPYHFKAELSQLITEPAIVKYRIVINKPGGTYTFPGQIKGNPWAWDFYNKQYWVLKVLPNKAPLHLFSPASEANKLNIYPNLWKPEDKKVLPVSDLESQLILTDNSASHPIIACELYIGDKIEQNKLTISDTDKISFSAKTCESCSIKVILIDKNGNGYSHEALTDNGTSFNLTISDFKPDQHVLLPRPYPSFQALWYQNQAPSHKLKVQEIDKIQVIAESKNGKCYLILNDMYLKNKSL